MKITGWTYWDNPEYQEIFSTEEASWDNVNKVKQLIADELRKCGFKFNGYYHQDGEHGVPVIDDKWVYQCSCRTWGGIMAMAYPEEIEDDDGFGYMTWAWLPPSQEEMVVPLN